MARFLSHFTPPAPTFTARPAAPIPTVTLAVAPHEKAPTENVEGNGTGVDHKVNTNGGGGNNKKASAKPATSRPAAGAERSILPAPGTASSASRAPADLALPAAMVGGDEGYEAAKDKPCDAVAVKPRTEAKTEQPEKGVASALTRRKDDEAEVKGKEATVGEVKGKEATVGAKMLGAAPSPEAPAKAGGRKKSSVPHNGGNPNGFSHDPGLIA